MACGYDETISLVWSTPSDKILPSNPDPLSPRLPPAPAGTRRAYVQTRVGPLEVLYALPGGGSVDDPVEERWKAPVLFQHGGFGSANCYSNFLPWFAARGYPAYSLSLRGHGYSWYPSFWAMFFTPKHVLADDVAAVLTFIKARHEGSGPITLVGHSSGGGLSQHVVDSGKGVGVGKLVVLAGIPSFGGWRVYVNLFKLDPWFPIRILRDFYHPRSALSTTRLVHNTFFSPTYPVEKAQKFEAEMSPYEFMLWPSGMMFPFISCARVLKNLLVTCPPESKKRVPLLAISGTQDTLVSHPIMRRMAHVYAATNVGIRAKVRDISSLQYEGTSGIQGEKEGEGEAGVWFAEIAAPGAGHNLMRDDGWERCARVLEAFLDA